MRDVCSERNITAVKSTERGLWMGLVAGLSGILALLEGKMPGVTGLTKRRR